MRTFENVLVFMRGVGTTLCATHVFDAVTATYPNHTPRFFLVVPEQSTALYQDMLTAYPHVRVVSTGATHRLSTLRMFLSLVARKNFVITGPTHHGNPPLLRIVAFLLSRRGVYVGFETSISAHLLQDYTASLSAGESVFHTMAGTVASVSGVHTEVPVRFHFHKDTDILARHGIAPQRYIFIHPFAGSPVRELPQARWVRILHEVSMLYPHFKIVISGSEKDKNSAERLCSEANLGTSVVSIAGACSMQEIATLITHAAAYLGVDTGITHLASVLKAPAVLIGNNSNPYWLPTYSTNTTILTANEHCTCNGAKGGACWVTEAGQQRYRCMVEISDETILKALKDTIEQRLHSL